MITAWNRYNIYLRWALILALLAGCRTQGDSKKKVVATLRVHLEVVADSMDFSTRVPILRSNPVMVTVDKAPFLTEANVSEAKVVDVLGGFDLQIQFDRQGTWLLESYTTSNPGRHFAIFSTFMDQEKKAGRWLGAPVVSGRISNGLLSFTPDATRDEAEHIAIELNNVAKQNKKKDKW